MKCVVRDPVFQDEDGLWFFWDETWTDMVGPFPTEEIARKEIAKHAKLLDRKKGMKKFVVLEMIGGVPTDTGDHYLVVNVDKPCARRVFDIVKAAEMAVGEWNGPDEFMDFVNDLCGDWDEKIPARLKTWDKKSNPPLILDGPGSLTTSVMVDALNLVGRWNLAIGAIVASEKTIRTVAGIWASPVGGRCLGYRLVSLPSISDGMVWIVSKKDFSVGVACIDITGGKGSA